MGLSTNTEMARRKDSPNSPMSKAVIYVAGGGMSGIFGAGVLATLEAGEAYGQIEAIYGASAGALDAAYFLARQTDYGASVYFENMQAGFFDKPGFWFGAISRFMMHPIYPTHPEHHLNAMHLSHLEGILTQQKSLQFNRILAQPVPLYVKVFDQHNHRVRYIDIKSADPLKLLLASASMPPYTFEYELVHHRRLVDSCIAEIIGLDYFLHKYSGHKVIFIVNRQLPSGLSNKLICRLESIAGAHMYGKAYRSYPFAREAKFRDDVARIRRHPNFLLIMPPKTLRLKPQTTDPARLRRAYAAGKRAGHQALNFINQ